MKRLLIAIGVLVLVFLCKENFAQEKLKVKENKSKMKDGEKKMKPKGMDSQNIDFPYTAAYSSDFEIGNPAHSKMILELWKDFDENAFDRHDYMADTILMIFADGYMLKGKDSAMAGAKSYRSTLSSVTSTIDAWVPLRSKDKNEDWVAIWGTSVETGADGKINKMDVQEIWQINKDGKVVFMKQFASKAGTQE